MGQQTGNHRTSEAEDFSRLNKRFLRLNARCDGKLYTEANAILARLRVLPQGIARNAAGMIEMSVICQNYNSLLRALDDPANLTTFHVAHGAPLAAQALAN